jgi:transketolase
MVMRPADTIETAECWEIALANRDRPTLLALSRQGLPALREDGEVNRSVQGAYILDEADGSEQVRLFATGSEVSAAREAKRLLAERGICAAVVSIPCFELFEDADPLYRRHILGSPAVLKVGIEAAVRQGWDAIIGPDGIFIGMHSFGESAPAADLFKHFGITAEAVAGTVSSHIERMKG